MVHISKTKKGFQVTLVDDKNNKVIQRSEGLSSKAACYKNMIAAAQEFNTIAFPFQDNTLKTPALFAYEIEGRKWKKRKTFFQSISKPYQPK